MRGPFVDQLFKYYYGRYTDYNSIFFDWIKDHITKETVILEIGAGAGKNYPYDFGKLAKTVIGIDTDPRILDNSNLHLSYCNDFFDNNFENHYFDIVFANNVVEHIQEPEKFLTEIRRILRPNGYFFYKTPNLLHYASIIAYLTPYWFHKFYCTLSGRIPEDTFPTFYYMNSRRKIEKLSKALNFNYEIRTYESQPDYLFLDPITFLMGVCYERLVNRYKFLNKYRIVLMVKIVFH